MGIIATTLPTVGADRGTEETDIVSALAALFGLVNGSLDNANLAAAANIAGSKLATGAVGATQLASSAVTADKTDATTLAAKLGLSQAGAVRRGKSNIATEESRANAAYGLLTTPDRVQSIVLPTDGLICVAFQGMFKSTPGGAAGTAALFLGSNQVKRADGGAQAAPAAQEVATSVANTYVPFTSSPGGLTTAGGATAYTGDVTTGQVVDPGGGASSPGGICLIFAAAGTYDVSVQYKANAGHSIFAKNRKLWVWTIGF